MAKNNNIKDFTKDIADAIRAKENSVAKINPQDFSTRITALSVGGSSKFAELVDGSLTTIEESDLKDVESIRASAFANLLNLTSVSIPSNVKTIGRNAFAGDTYIETLNLSDGLEDIQFGAFSGVLLKNLVLPSTLKTIGGMGFTDHELNTVTIPSSVESIADHAFMTSYEMQEVIIESKTPFDIGEQVFPTTVQIYVPYSAYDDYVASWTDYASQIVRLPAIPSTITVIVNDYTGALMSGASVTISGNGQTYTGTTDSVGTFTQGDLQPATYTISVADMEGLKTPASSEVVVEEDTQNSVTVTYLEKPLATTYGVKIDLNNSDPETSVTYTDDAVGFEKSYMDFDNDTFEYGSWQDEFPFNQIRPCILKDGVVTKYLNPNNYTEDVDGNPVDITTTCDGDVMIEIPKIYYRLHKDENYQYIQISNTMQDGFCCLAHTYKGVEKDRVYIGAYPSYYDGSVSRSVSGVAPTQQISLRTWRTYARRHGAGYETFYWNLLVLLQCLYTIQFKNLNSQSVLGYGLSYRTPPISSGALDSNGLYYGQKGSGSTIKFLGIEDLYSFLAQTIDGAIISTRNLKTIDVTNPNADYNDTSSYIDRGFTMSDSGEGYMKTIMGENESGFVPTAHSGGGVTYFCDRVQVYATNSIPSFGGAFYAATSGSPAGMYALSFYNTSSDAVSYVSRLAYCG